MNADKGWTFVQLPIWILCDNRINSTSKIVLAYLRWRQGNDGCCWPSRGKIARDLNVSERTVSRCLVELRGAGYVEVYFRDGQSSVYKTFANPRCCGKTVKDIYYPGSETHVG